MPAMPLKSKVNSQGEIPSAARIDSMRVTHKTPDLVRAMDFQAMKTNPENKIDVYKTVNTKASHTPAKASAFAKQEPVVAKKRKPEPVPSPRSSQHLKKPLVEPKVESKRDSSRPVGVARQLPAKSPADPRQKESAGKLGLDATGITTTTETPLRRDGKAANQSMFASLSSGSQFPGTQEDSFPDLKKFVSEENILGDGPQVEGSIRELGKPQSPEAASPEERENSFCEITSKQDVSLGLHTDFIDSFRAIQPSSPVSPTSNQLTLNGTHISFEKKHHQGSIEESGAELLSSLDKLQELQKENSKALANFFLLGSEIIRDEDERIEVHLNKRMDRKPSSRHWRDDFGVDVGVGAGALGPENPFFKNDLENTDTFSLKKRSPNSSVETPKRPSDITDPRNFDTFRNQPVLEVASVKIFSRPARPVPIREVASVLQISQKKARSATGGQFEDIVLSSKFNEALNHSLAQAGSSSSLEMVCQHCRVHLHKASEQASTGKASADHVDSNPSSSRYLIGVVGGTKRPNFLQLSNDEVRLSPTIDGLPKSSFSKTNSGGVGLSTSGQTRPSKMCLTDGDAGAETRETPKSPHADLSLSSLSSTDSPLKALVSIFKKIVVFNSKWERVKESLFLTSPDIVARVARALGNGSHGRIAWPPLAEFLQKRRIPIQKQQLARLIFYVQSFVADQEGQLSAVANYSFFNFLLTPKFMYSAEDAPASPPVTHPSEPDFSREEVAFLSEILRVVAHKVDYFAMSFKSLQPEFVQRMFACLSRGGPVVSREDLVAAITANEAQIKVQDVCFVLDEFQSGTSGISWTCFSEYFDKKIWRL